MVAPQSGASVADAVAASLREPGGFVTGTPTRRRASRASLMLVRVAVAGLLACTIFAELGDRWWIADLFAHFRFQYIVVASLLAGWALLLRKRLLAMGAALLIVPQAMVVAGVPAAAKAGATAREERIRVVTANIQWRNANRDTLAAHFRDLGADVIALQEVTPAAFPLLLALQKEYPHLAPTDWREQAYGVVVLSRHPLEAVRHLHEPMAPIVTATVRRPAGSFRFVALHAPYPLGGGLYELHARYFAGWIGETRQSEMPVVVAGDFNLTPWSPRFRAAWRASGLSFAGEYRMWPRTWPAHAVPWKYLPALLIGGLPIDHVLVSRHFAVVEAGRGPYIGSDHYPVAVELRLRP